jgi:histidine triad (HIT) family protein
MASPERVDQTPMTLENTGDKPCVFCQIKEGKQPSIKIAESDEAISFMSQEGHPLVVPKKHVNEDLEENIEGITDAFKLATELVPFVKDIYQVTGVNMVANVGKSAGQAVPHFHIHLLPRREGDNGPRLRPAFTPKKKEFESLAGRISKRFEASKISTKITH